ncbi:MAG: hypothetical protein KIT82_07035 [Bradyrhizobium sp.]|nr:hypothetical protein [Bradyrhizobium sp.]
MSATVLPFPGPPKFNRPEIPRDIAKGLLVPGNGGDLSAELARHEFEAQNPGVYLHQEYVAREDARTKRLLREYKFAQLRRACEPLQKVVVTADVLKRLPLFSWIKASTFLLLGLGGVFIGNQVGAAYIRNSGVDWYADDAVGPILFMAASLLGAGALKGFECFIATSLGKRLYAFAIFATGLPALIAWMAAFAIIFAPDATGGMDRLMGNSRHGPEMISLLVFLHLLVDVFLAYICFAGAEKVLLAGNVETPIPNPERVHWDKRIETLETELIESAKVRGQSLDWLAAWESAARAHETTARLSSNRERKILEEIAKAAISTNNADALK